MCIFLIYFASIEKQKQYGKKIKRSEYVLIILLRHQTSDYSSFYQTNVTFVVTDDRGASTVHTPTIEMCACSNGGQCIPPELGDQENTEEKFVVMGCACAEGYAGRFCKNDIDACEANGQPCYPGVTCEDLPAPAGISGYKCGPCPLGYSGDGAKCLGDQLLVI